MLQNRNFTALLVVFSLVNIASMAFIASSSYIYVDGFGLSEQVYSFFFAVNAAGLMLGPMVYLQLSKRFRRGTIINVCFGLIAASGLLVFLLGSLQPWIFAATLWPASIAGSCMRPPGVNLMLEQQKEDTGSASSLIGCYGILMGSLGMLIVSFEWMDTILMVGILNLVIGVICAVLWPFVFRRTLIPEYMNHPSKDAERAQQEHQAPQGEGATAA